MPVYEYTALDVRGKSITGIIDTESALTARQKLRSSKIYPVSIKEVYADTSKKDGTGFGFLRSFSRVKPSEVALMTRQLATLINAGFPLVTAIATLIPQCKTQAFKTTLSQIKDSIEEGQSFAESLAIYPDAFSSIYINMVRAGESSGTLEIVLERLADITEKQQALNNRIKSAMAYPIIMSVIGTMVLIFLLTFVVPNITSMFADMDQELPTITIILITISDILKHYWWIILIGMAGLIFLFRSIKKTEKGRYMLDRTALFAPVIGQLNIKLAVARFARTLGSLLENGVSMLTALEIVKNIVGNVIISDTINYAAKEVEKGNGLGNSLGASEVFPHLSIQMVQVGEQSGELENMLNKIADVYENEVDLTVNSMTSMMEPIIIVVMAVVIGFIVLSIMLPIMKIPTLV
jgi:general secretion pathway protein F